MYNIKPTIKPSYEWPHILTRLAGVSVVAYESVSLWDHGPIAQTARKSTILLSLREKFTTSCSIHAYHRSYCRQSALFVLYEAQAT